MLSTQVTAATPFFKRIEEWRIKHGRDPKTGRRVRGRSKLQSPVDAVGLIVIALRQMALRTKREDLRPVYVELADMFEEETVSGTNPCAKSA